ncbi:MAG: hypothetical protein ACRD36_11445, partial [Candidatus Acidiferrum sp.]
MELRILDMDRSLVAQSALRRRLPQIVPLEAWGPRIRLACGARRFRRFAAELAKQLGGSTDHLPSLTMFGSGDFHHVTLALLARLAVPCNLLVIDKHPDWMRNIPVLHCGTWLWHATRLPTIHTIYHVGGDIDFDNWYRWFAPWRE